MIVNKVLLVDDDADIRRIGQLSLQAVGKWNVVLAASGAEALLAAEREAPDLILLDVMMPEMDGPTTLQRLRETKATAMIPVLFLTAKVQRNEVERFLQLGAQGVIRKPFDPMLLPKEILQLVTPL